MLPHIRLLTLALGSAMLFSACSGDETTDAGVGKDGTPSGMDATPTGDAGANPDAMPGDAPVTVDSGGSDGGTPTACAKFASPATTLSTYPATYSGDSAGTGASVQVAEGVCTDERSFFPQEGEEHVIALTNLTAGQAYQVHVTAPADISFYVATGCTEASGGPAAGQCALFVDQGLGTEDGDFMAPANGNAFLVIDHYDPPPTDDGTYTVEVFQRECSTNPDCTMAATPICLNGRCVQCADVFDCTNAATPICTAGTCVAGPALCTADDAQENGSDGPAGATVMTPATANTPSSVTGKICNEPAAESDWFRYTLAAEGSLAFTLTWTSTSDMDLYLLNSEGTTVAQAAETSSVSPEQGLARDLPAGTYYFVVVKYDPPATAAAEGYTLTVRLPECSTNFECQTPANPVCSATGTCGAGDATCVNDDAGDNNDDGPAGARDVTPAVGMTTTTNGRICNSSDTELDFYRVDVANGEGLEVTLAWPGTEDLDLVALGVPGTNGRPRLIGEGFYAHPEVVTLTNLPAGRVYLLVDQFGMQGTTTAAYTLTVRRTAASPCTTAADCASEYSTQLFRGRCVSGACLFIEGAGAVANGAICDDGTDCTSTFCSYIPFESDAEKSVCSVACTGAAECAALGNGYTCLVEAGFCVPACTTDLQCGANIGSDTPDPTLPWDYLTCTAATGVCAP